MDLINVPRGPASRARARLSGGLGYLRQDVTRFFSVLGCVGFGVVFRVTLHCSLKQRWHPSPGGRALVGT